MGISRYFPTNTTSAHPKRCQSDEEPSVPELEEAKKDPADVTNSYLNVDDGGSVASSAPDGVKKAQATTIVWTRKALIIAYGLIFLVFFVNSLQQQISNNLVAYVTSAFSKAGLTATISIVSTLVAGVIKLPVAKLMDVWGRPQGFVFMLVCAVIGLILMAASTNVETYAAAQVFYWVGFDGIAYVLDVFIADTSSLEWRALMFAFSTSPYIATTFAGPAAAQSFYTHSTWKWAYGTFAIVTPVICMPFLLVFWYNQRLARKQGILVDRREASGLTWVQSVRHYLIEFDVIGMILICAGFALLLLPFSLATSQAQKWRSGSIIAMLVIGVCCLIGFGIHERFTAKKSFLPFRLLVDRTVLGSCLLSGTLWISFYCWDAYFSVWLQVVHNLSITDAGYVANTYNIGSCFFSIVIGVLIRYSGRFKWIALACVPLQILGTGLMIYFREPQQGIGYVVMCQIFIAFSGGALLVTEELAIMAAVGPENVAVALALQALFTSVGGAIGSSISGAIWTNTVPGLLVKYLPESAKGQANEIYDSLPTALSYAWGSPERDAIIRAYSESQRYQCIAATAVLVFAFFCVLIWRDIKVKDFKKPAGATVI